MSGAATDLRTYLVTGLGYSTLPVRVGGLPETPDACVALIAYGGTAPVRAMGQHNVVERVRFVQVLVRGPKDGTAAVEANAEALWQLFRAALNVTVGASHYDQIVVTNEPSQVTPDGNERPIYAFSVDLWKRGS